MSRPHHQRSPCPAVRRPPAFVKRRKTPLTITLELGCRAQAWRAKRCLDLPIITPSDSIRYLKRQIADVNNSRSTDIVKKQNNMRQEEILCVQPLIVFNC